MVAAGSVGGEFAFFVTVWEDAEAGSAAVAFFVVHACFDGAGGFFCFYGCGRCWDVAVWGEFFLIADNKSMYDLDFFSGCEPGVYGFSLAFLPRLRVIFAE
jgi:hypothetical protein